MRAWGVAVVVVVAVVVLAGACGDDDDGGDSGSTPATTTSAPPTTTEPPAPPAAFGEETVVVGHRGAAGHHPDNSLEGFAAARELGATWVELDVRLSADGDVVLSHDPETAAGSVVAATSSADLAAEGLPTLLEALDVIDEHALGVDVEIKSDPFEEGYDPSLAVVDATMAVLESRPPAGPVVVSSFDRAAIDRVRQLTGDDWDTALIAGGVGGAADLQASLVADGHEGVVLNYEAATPDVVSTLVDGLTVWSYTVDDPAVAADLLDLGVTGIVTDVPDEIRPVID